MGKTNRLNKEDMEEVYEYQNSKRLKDKREIIKILEKNFKPRKRQQDYLNILQDSTITICSGSSGSGKTMTSVFFALRKALEENKKLVLIRPIFESASQKIGFLKGDLEQKLEPHIQAFKYILNDLIGDKLTDQLIDQDIIKFEILNYLRGATLTNSVICVDESQNMLVDEMILATTRIGKSSSIIFTGDFYQSDLRKAKGSILEFAEMIKDIKGVGKFTFTSKDVVRNKILIEVTKKWEEYKDLKGM